MATGVRSRTVTGLCLILLCAGAVFAQEMRYVSDRVVLPIRGGPGEEFEPLGTVTTGDQIQLLQASDNGYARVRLASGLEGWLPQRHLSDTVTPKIQAQQMQKRIEDLLAERELLSELNRGLESERDGMEDSLIALRTTQTQAQEELAAFKHDDARSAGPGSRISILQRRVARLQSQAEALRHQGDALARTERREWFLYGGGIALGGVLLGAILARMRWRRRSPFDRF